MPAGQPRKYSSPEQMQKAICKYFADTKQPGVCALALHLGFASRQSFCDYKGYSKGFSDVIKKAIMRIEAYHEGRLSNVAKPTGSIFWLKNHGWADKQEIAHSGDLSIKVINYGSEDANNTTP